MKTLDQAMFAPHLTFVALKAEDFMTPNPVSIRQSATVFEAATFLASRGLRSEGRR